MDGPGTLKASNLLDKQVLPWVSKHRPKLRIQAVAASWCDHGLGPGTTSQSEEEPCCCGGTVDGNAAKDGRSESRDGIGGQISGRGQTIGSPRHLDLCRRRSTGTSVAATAPATDPRYDRPRNFSENDRRADEHEGNATGAAAWANAITPMTPTVTQGSEPFQELQVTQEAYLREAMRQAAVPASRPPEPQMSTSHELLYLLSKIDALPRLQTIQWIPKGPDPQVCDDSTASP